MRLSLGGGGEAIHASSTTMRSRLREVPQLACVAVPITQTHVGGRRLR
jgi:hypothetical protein